jgi:hypothetical protein
MIPLRECAVSVSSFKKSRPGSFRFARALPRQGRVLHRFPVNGGVNAFCPASIIGVEQQGTPWRRCSRSGPFSPVES